VTKCLLRNFYFFFWNSKTIFPPPRSYDMLQCSLIFVCCGHKCIAINPKSAIFLVITKRVVVIHLRRFGTTYLTHLQGLKMGKIFCSESSVWNYHYSLRNSPEERSCHVLHGGNLESRINPLKTKRRLLYLKTQSVPRCKHFSSRL
jgi:hypothetical protein